MPQKVMVGMSGGVDSSVAALLLMQQGYEVTGVTFKLWDDPAEDSGCCSADDVRDAAYVCSQLGIPHYVFNYKELFRQEVVQPFIEEYLRGRTPNPCIRCNRAIKFGAFSGRIRELGYDFIATGHYARTRFNEATGRYELLRAVHPAKDQSYVLYNLTQEQLACLLLPLGGYEKQEIREIAAKSGLVVAKKPDSQDICFVPDGDYGAFLERYAGIHPAPGEFVDCCGRCVGQHRGIIHYTVGQRKGLGVSLGKPAYVQRIDPDLNRVVLTTEESDIFTCSVLAEDTNYISIPQLERPIEVMAKIRYAHPLSPALLLPGVKPGTVRLEFKEPQRAPAPGQAVVFYQGDTVIGGGTILPNEEELL